jgi:hypothetical protein
VLACKLRAQLGNARQPSLFARCLLVRFYEIEFTLCLQDKYSVELLIAHSLLALKMGSSGSSTKLIIGTQELARNVELRTRSDTGGA